MKHLVFFLAAVLLVFPVAADIGIGENLGISQDYMGSETSFTQERNFTSLDVFPYTTGFETSNYTASTIPYDPVAYYPLDGTGEDLIGDSDITEGSADLRQGVLGEENSSRYFDGSGSDYLRVSNPDFGIADSQSVTVSMWKKGDGEPRESAAFAGHSADGDTRQIWTHAPWSDETVYWDTTGDGYESRISGTPSGPPNYNNWHHYLFVHNANTGRKEIWFDGTMIASSTSETQSFEEIVDFYIGADSDSPSYPMQGSIDNLAIYNRSLSDSEIQYVYENTDGGETDIQMDFYDYSAGLQDYVSNFSAQTDSNTAHFKVGNLPGDLFYEAFNSVTGERFYIGYTRNDVFNFTVPEFTSEEVSIFHYGEKGVEIDNITFNNSKPVEGETLGIKEEIFNEGVVEDEAVNKTLTISTYNGSGWQQKQFRSEDLAVPIENTDTKQSFTAQFKGSFTNTTQYRTGGGQLGLGYQNGTSGDNLVGYWRMDEAVSGTGETVTDYSGEGNDGNTNGGVTTGSQGWFGTNSFDFDGEDDYVQAPEPLSESEYDSKGTFSLWVKPTNVALSDYFFPIGSEGSGGAAYRHRIKIDDGLWSFQIKDEDGNWHTAEESSQTAGEGKWQHIVATWDDTDGMILYVDSSQAATNSHTGTSQGGYEFGIASSSDTGSYFNGVIDGIRVYNRSLSESEVEDLYFNGLPFRGSYTTEEIQEGELTKWYRVNLDASIPDETELDAEFRALDSSGNVVDTDSFGVESGDNYYNVSVQDSEGAELYLNGSSQNVTKSWEVNSLKVISGGPYVDPWEVKPGPWRFNVSLDPDDEVKETNETNNNFRETLDVDSYQVFYGDTNSSKVVGADDRDIYRWRPEQESGLLFFYDVDSSFNFEDLEPVNSSDLTELDSALRMRGHNDSIQEIWDRDGDGSIDRFESYSIEGRTVSVPVTNSSEDSVFDTGILYDSGDGSGFDGSQDIVFVSKILKDRTGSYGNYDYEARVPFFLGELRDGSDKVEVFSQLN